MKMLIDTEPCKTCDFSPVCCGRDIEDCMRYPENKIGGDSLVYHNSGRLIRNGKGEYFPDRRVEDEDD